MVETRAQRRQCTGATPAKEELSRRRHAATDEESIAADPEDVKKETGLRGDWGAIGLLMLLYTLQGIPMGLSGSIPFLMQAKGVGMSEQARFSVVSWPFSLKLLWAPLVDSIYSSSFGRRKTWIVPAQLTIGGLLLYASRHMDGYLGDAGSEPDVGSLTSLFLVFYFLAATQDIAVDGLALTVLSARNKELGATCNAIGQTVGYFLAYTVFLALNTPEFCNKYLRSAAAQSDEGLFSLGGFMAFWGWVFLASTLCVLLVRRDEHTVQSGTLMQQLGGAYKEMLLVVQLPAVRSMALMLLTCRVAISAFEAVVPLRLVESGVPRETLALLASAVMPVGMASQAYVSYKYFSGGNSKPMSIWLGCYPLRLAAGLLSFGLVKVAAGLASPDGLPLWLYGAMLALTVASTLCSSVMFVALMAFFNKVSDPAMGGTYMTMLNTLANMGGAWTGTLALASVDKLTVKRCVDVPEDECTDPPCACVNHTDVDGFTVLAIVGSVLGVAWLACMRSRILKMEDLPASAWLASGGDAAP